MTKRGRPKGFVSEMAEKTGMSKRSIQLSIERAEKIPEDVRDMIRGTHLDRGAYLDRIKNLDDEDQRATVVRDLAAGTSKSSSRRTKLEVLKDAWLAADDRERLEFIRWTGWF